MVVLFFARPLSAGGTTDRRNCGFTSVVSVMLAVTVGNDVELTVMRVWLSVPAYTRGSAPVGSISVSVIGMDAPAASVKVVAGFSVSGQLGVETAARCRSVKPIVPVFVTRWVKVIVWPGIASCCGRAGPIARRRMLSKNANSEVLPAPSVAVTSTWLGTFGSVAVK